MFDAFSAFTSYVRACHGHYISGPRGFSHCIQGCVVQYEVGKATSLLHTIRELSRRDRCCAWQLSEAIPLVTANVARVLKLENKGKVYRKWSPFRVAQAVSVCVCAHALFTRHLAVVVPPGDTVGLVVITVLDTGQLSPRCD